MSKTLESIGFYTLFDERARNVSLGTPLQRCELLLTDACNFSCPYCRGSNEYTKGTISLDWAKHIVSLWADGNLRNIRFSGGEPTLFNDLDELVSYTKSRGVERIAISTNGSADFSLYKELVDAGVDDFSISLDACCSSTGDTMAGGKSGSWKTVVSNIAEISKLTYVTVGVVLTDYNFDELVKTIEYATELGVSDIRIISAAQWNNEEKFVELFKNSEVMTKHPILKYRIENFLSDKNVRGIGSEDNHSCPLVIDDMAVAGNHHFPCIIALREGCKPIGTIDNKSIEEIRRERYDWFEKTDTFKSNICSSNCLDVCVFYNNKVRELNKVLNKGE